MTTEENKAVVRRWWEESINRKNLAVIDELFAHNFVGHLPGMPEPLRGPEGEKQLDTMFSTAFPDGKLTIEDMIAEGDRVMSGVTFRGTQRGPFQGIPSTGRQVTMSGMHECRIANGQIVEAWNMPDMFGLMQQLGVIPPAPPTETTGEYPAAY